MRSPEEIEKAIAAMAIVVSATQNGSESMAVANATLGALEWAMGEANIFADFVNSAVAVIEQPEKDIPNPPAHRGRKRRQGVS